MAIIRRPAASAILFCSAGWQPAVSADWQSAERRFLNTGGLPIRDTADYQSALLEFSSVGKHCSPPMGFGYGLAQSETAGHAVHSVILGADFFPPELARAAEHRFRT